MLPTCVNKGNKKKNYFYVLYNILYMLVERINKKNKRFGEKLVQDDKDSNLGPNEHAIHHRQLA